jgi:hypothetical protein
MNPKRKMTYMSQAQATKYISWQLIAQSAVALLVTISIILSTWTVGAVAELRREMAVTRSEQEVTKKAALQALLDVSLLKDRIAALPQEAPPKWWKTQVDDAFTRLATQIERVELKIEHNATKLGNIETDFKLHTAKP